MARPRTVEPDVIVAAVVSGDLPAEVARNFGVSRVRVSQILEQHAPHLLKRKKGPTVLTDEQIAAKAEERAKVVEALNTHDMFKDAAASLNLTPSGLYSRMDRLGIVLTPA